MATIDRYFGSWKGYGKVEQPYYAPVKTLTAPKDSTVVGQEAENVMLAWKFDGAAGLQNDTLQVISNMLNNGKSRTLRPQHQ